MPPKSPYDRLNHSTVFCKHFQCIESAVKQLWASFIYIWGKMDHSIGIVTTGAYPAPHKIIKAF